MTTQTWLSLHVSGFLRTPNENICIRTYDTYCTTSLHGEKRTRYCMNLASTDRQHTFNCQSPKQRSNVLDSELNLVAGLWALNGCVKVQVNF